MAAQVICRYSSNAIDEMIDAETLSTLMMIGSSSIDDSSLDELYQSIRDCGEINCRHWSEWEMVLSGMPPQDIGSVLRGLTRAECRLKWCGGSVAASIWVFRYLYRVADGAVARETADWVVAHTSNRYSPFGTTRHSSFDQWVYEQTDHYHGQQLIRRRLLDEAQRRAVAARLQRAEERQRQHQFRCELRRQQSAKRREELAEFENLALAIQLEIIASDWTRTLEYWPKSVAQRTAAELESVPKTTREKLLDRLRVRLRADWRGFRRRLQSLS